jgi:hypothetical protein
MSEGTGSERIIIEGIGEDNKKFRPSNWAVRISSMLASFGSDHRLRYSEFVHPCIIKGEQCLVVNRGLNKTQPEAFEFILQFARQNKLRIQEDRRVKQREIEVERRTEKQEINPLTDETRGPQPIHV